MNILLADDDKDDCLLFREALEELQLQVTLTTVHDGDQLMQLLVKNVSGPFHVLFLDLNMPRKNGFTCLDEIKRNEKLKQLPVIIFSTSFDQATSEQLYKKGAHYYICKPPDFCQLKKLIHHSIALIRQNNSPQPTKENFLLSDVKAILF